jgi:hypothetical protein
MGVVPLQLAKDLRDGLGLERGVETGTYLGHSARLLASVFPKVLTIEVDRELFAAADRSLADNPAIEVLEGDSRAILPRVVDASIPTLYWLDGHWSGGPTGGSEDECPVIAEVSAISAGHPNDCLLIDDARMFLAPPPAPHRPEQWPTFRQVGDAIAETRPGHLVVVAHDIIIAAPKSCMDFVVAFAHHAHEHAHREPLSFRLARLLRRRGGPSYPA